MTSLRARRITDAVLFDLDGVIVDSRVPFARSVNAAFAAHDLPTRPDDELHGYLGPPLHGTFARLGATGPLVQSCVDAYRRRYSAMAAAETPVFAGMRAVIEELARALPLVVATSKPRALAEPLLTDLGLRPFFRAVVGPGLDAEDERKAVTIGRALQEFAAPASPVMVGDRKFDVAGAREHAIPTIGVLWGIGSADELREAGAHALARVPGELSPLVTTTAYRDHVSCDVADMSRR